MRTGREATGEVSLLPAADIMYYCTLNQYWMMLGSDQCLTIDHHHHYHQWTVDRLVRTLWPAKVWPLLWLWWWELSEVQWQGVVAVVGWWWWYLLQINNPVYTVHTPHCVYCTPLHAHTSHLWTVSPHNKHMAVLWQLCQHWHWPLLPTSITLPTPVTMTFLPPIAPLTTFPNTD